MGLGGYLYTQSHLATIQFTLPLLTTEQQQHRELGDGSRETMRNNHQCVSSRFTGGVGDYFGIINQSGVSDQSL